MPKPRTETGGKNCISGRLKELRNEHRMSQRALAEEFQLLGYNIGKDVIMRIENDNRYAADFELRAIMKVFGVTADELLKDD